MMRGRTAIELDLADSITTWRLAASAVTQQGALGAHDTSIRVFQPFFVDVNLPVTLTRGDEVAVPAVVYSYLDQPQIVRLDLAHADWFELQDETAKRITLEAGEVRATSFRIRVQKAGTHSLRIAARAGDVADAIERTIEIVPDGRRVEEVASGTLQPDAHVNWTIAPTAIEGSIQAILRLYPSSFSEVVSGLDAVFQQPYGCFEQTSSTTYPNVLAPDYLHRTRRNQPEVELKARQYIHLGYQRLLGFEVSGGGFDWFGRPPANRTLTAYGLMEFVDMARVHDVDPDLINRTRKWLLQQMGSDGSWDPESHALHDDPTRGARSARLATTAYIAWAVFGDRDVDGSASNTVQYLTSYVPESIDDPYTLALVANALLAIPQGRHSARPYLDRLRQTQEVSPDGQFNWWEASRGSRTMFHGAGRSAWVETTALASLALIKSGAFPDLARRSLAWLITQKDARGTWHSTQATVLALKRCWPAPVSHWVPRRSAGSRSRSTTFPYATS